MRPFVALRLSGEFNKRSVGATFGLQYFCILRFDVPYVNKYYTLSVYTFSALILAYPSNPQTSYINFFMTIIKLGQGQIVVLNLIDGQPKRTGKNLTIDVNGLICNLYSRELHYVFQTSITKCKFITG